jgi:hypothetical protein
VKNLSNKNKNQSERKSSLVVVGQRVIVIVIIVLSITSFTREKGIVITQLGYDDIQLGETTIAQIKRRYPFAKHTKTFKHFLLRPNDDRVGKTIYYEQLITKKGIVYFFNYERGVTKILLDEILFLEKSHATTDTGIKLGQSTFADVEEKYGKQATYFREGKAIKEYDKIIFYADRFQVDSLYNHQLVTQIRIKAH